MNRGTFYAALRRRGSGVFGTSLSQAQVDGCEVLLNEAEKRKTPLRHLAYILATTYHETAHTMQPIREMGGEKYLQSKKYYPYVGMGYVQLTWLENYQKATQKLGVDFVKNPRLLLVPAHAVRILFQGMEEGWFTGKKLNDYILGTKVDYVNARRIINGVDRKDMLAGYAKAFEAALTEAGYSTAPAPSKPSPAPTPTPKPQPAPAPATGGVWAALGRILSKLFGRPA